MAEPVKTRRYDASRRRAAAAERRRAILRAAADLFLADGYPQTTIAAIAARAGVSEDLIFTLFTNKRGVLKHVMDVGIGGDDQDIPLLERQGPQTMRHSSDQHEQLRLFAAGITAQLERVAPYNDLVRTAASVEPEIAALQDDLHLRQRRLAMTTIAGWIEANGPLQRRDHPRTRRCHPVDTRQPGRLPNAHQTMGLDPRELPAVAGPHARGQHPPA